MTARAVLDTDDLSVIEADDHYTVLTMGADKQHSFVIPKLWYNNFARNLRLAMDIIEHIEDRR